MFTSKPSIRSDNKLTNSAGTHPHGTSEVAHYFYVPSDKKSDRISITWPSNSLDLKSQEWNADVYTTTDESKSLAYILSDLADYHVVIGPRFTNSWSGNGIENIIVVLISMLVIQYMHLYL